MSVRIQFDIEESQLERMIPYISNEKYRHVFAHKALSEWLNRQEGRDKRVKDQNDEKLKAHVLSVINEMKKEGLIK